MYKKTMREALEQTRAYRDPVNEDRGFSSQQIKQAYGVLNDPRYKQGNYSGAYKAIEKIAKGLASHPDVANALKRANEELEEAKTAGGALAQGHLETMTDQRFKEFYGMTKDEYIKKHGDPRKEEVKEDFKAGDKVKYVGDNPRYKDKTGTISHIATGKGPYNHLVTGIIKGAIAVDPKDLVKEEVELELDESLQLSKVKAYTRSNDHFGARIYIAQQMRDKDMESIYQGLETMHRKYGNTVGNNAILFRDKIERLLYGKIVGKWGTKAGNIIIKEL